MKHFIIMPIGLLLFAWVIVVGQACDSGQDNNQPFFFPQGDSGSNNAVPENPTLEYFQGQTDNDHDACMLLAGAPLEESPPCSTCLCDACFEDVVACFEDEGCREIRRCAELENCGGGSSCLGCAGVIAAFGGVGGSSFELLQSAEACQKDACADTCLGGSSE